jgi:flavin-dependent dehydrogenase
MTEASSEVVDVVVVGGGPAGSTAAALLAEKGHTVVVLEKARFPRDHVGESLLPFCYPIFVKLGVVDEMARRFVRKPGVRFIDATGVLTTTWCFGHVIHDESRLSFHVLRGEFDEMLLKNAERKGATVHQETAVTSIELGASGAPSRVVVRGPDGEREIRARFVLDASGRETFLATKNAWKTAHPDLDRTALSTHWRGAKYTEGFQQGLLHIVYLGGEKKGWIWAIPVGLDRVSAGVVLNHSYIREQKAKLLAEGVTDWATALYRQEIGYSNFLREELAEASTIMPLMVNGDYSYSVSNKYGANFAMTGDAGTFIDPIFASGVYMAMNSSCLIADAIHAGLSTPDGDCKAELAKAFEHIDGAYKLVGKAIALFYNPESINFAQAGVAADILHARHADALAVAHFLIAGDFFTRHAHYERVLDLLENPRLFDTFRKLVIERPVPAASSMLGESTCDITRAEVFRAFLTGTADTVPPAG